MSQKILVSTTNSIEGMEIEKYFDLISTNVVLGTNLFADIGASFSDFFGGTSDTYQNKLERIYKSALDKLRHKAQNLRANGVVGVKIDFDEVSGGGKSMFMISISGMAVKLRSLRKGEGLEDERRHTVLPEDLDFVVNKLKLIDKVKSNRALNVNDWEFLMENPIPEIAPSLLDGYLEAFKDRNYAVTDYEKTVRKYFAPFLKQLDFNLVSDLLYDRLDDNNVVVRALILESESFSPNRSKTLFESNKRHEGVSTLEANKRFYTSEDLDEMSSILEMIKTMTSTGKIETVKGLLGSKEKFICESNHQNDSHIEYCSNCGKNIRGLIESEVGQIKNFELKVTGLRILLN